MWSRGRFVTLKFILRTPPSSNTSWAGGGVVIIIRKKEKYRKRVLGMVPQKIKYKGDLNNRPAGYSDHGDLIIKWFAFQITI